MDLNDNTVSVLPKKLKDLARLGRPIAPTGTYMKGSPPSHLTNHSSSNSRQTIPCVYRQAAGTTGSGGP